MPRVNPIHSRLPRSKVYHDNSACTERNNIEKSNAKQGTGGRRLCKHCKRLNRSRR